MLIYHDYQHKKGAIQTEAEHQQLITAEVFSAPTWLLRPLAQEIATVEDLVHKLHKAGLVDVFNVNPLLRGDFLKEAQQTSDNSECHEIPAIVEMLCVSVNLRERIKGVKKCHLHI